MFLYSYSKWI